MCDSPGQLLGYIIIITIIIIIIIIINHSSLPEPTTLQQTRGGGSFTEVVLHLKGQEMVSAWDQRKGKKVASDSAKRWQNFGCFCCNLKTKANKLLKYCKTFDSSEYYI